MFLFYPFHSFSRFLPIQRGRFGCDLWIFVACSQCPKKVVSFSICFARQVAVVARARKRWSWSCQRIRSRESSAFLLFFWLARNIPSLNFPWIIDHLSLFESWLPGQDYRTNCSQTMRTPTVSQWARIERFVHLEKQQSLGTVVRDMFTYVIVTWSFIKCWLLLWITGFC